MNKRLLLTSVALLGSAYHLESLKAAESTTPLALPFFSQRPQAMNSAQRLAGEAQHLDCWDMDRINGSLSVTPEYTRTFDGARVAQNLTFNGLDTMRFGNAGADGVTIAAREFILPQNFASEVTFRPRVENVLVYIDFRIGLDEWIPGLYIDGQTPINWTRWGLRLEETPINAGTDIPIATIGNNDAAVPAKTTSAIQGFLENVTQQDIKTEGRFASIQGNQTTTRLADIILAAGYNIVCNDWMHFGINGRVLIPTGNRPDGVFLFEPIAGTGKMAGLGAGLAGHFELWTNGCDEAFGFNYVANFYHLFSAHQTRTFDFTKNGKGSRYLLLKRFNPGAQPNTYEYAGEITRGINITTLEAKVGINFEADASFMFSYQRCNFTFDVGYNVWGRTAEKIRLVSVIDPNTWGIKGSTGTNPVLGQPDYMNLTNSRATISGANGAPDAGIVFISTSDLDIEGAQNPGAVSHKIFSHFGYTWDEADYTPFLGVGGEAEFSGRNDRALSQWGIWIKGGFFFC